MKTNNKKTTKPKTSIKPFSIKHYRFFPCVWSQNLKKGFKYYLIIRKRNSYLITHELESPKFKSEKEARLFVDENKDLSFMPA